MQLRACTATQLKHWRDARWRPGLRPRRWWLMLVRCRRPGYTPLLLGLVAVGGLPASPLPPTQVGSAGYSISWPQCGRPLPPGPAAVVIVGVTHGRPLSANPCLAWEYAWAAAHATTQAVYLNVAYGTSAVGPRHCAATDAECLAYNFGYMSAVLAGRYAVAQGVVAPTWWLDVEPANRWSSTPRRNAAVVQGAIAALTAQQRVVGLYSTARSWGAIVGGYQPRLTTWVAGPRNAAAAIAYCRQGSGFGGGSVQLVQYPGGGVDAAYVCPAAH